MDHLDYGSTDHTKYPRQMSPQETLAQALGHFQAGHLQESERLYRAIIAQEVPNPAEALHMLGVILAMTGRASEGADLILRAFERVPTSSVYAGNLGLALRMSDRPAEALDAFTTALKLDPGHSGAHLNVGNLLQERGELKNAAEHYRTAATLLPTNPDAPYNLGVVLREMGCLEEAESCLRRSLNLRPGFAEAMNNLGAVLEAKGKLDEALDCFHKASQADPNSASAHSNFLFSLHMHPDMDSRALFQEHRTWNQKHALPLAQSIRPHTNIRDPERPLRIAYVSPRFCGLPEGRFLLPLFREHDKARFKIYCYSDTPKADELTLELQRYAHEWRDIRGVSDDRVTDLIRNDQVDIAVDLMLHGANNRLLVFARKPAPVQVTYLAYCSTTGMDAMDYRLSDPYLDPAGPTDEFYSEQTIRLPETYWCYEPVVDLQPSALPARRNGFVTFGSLNTFSKVSSPTLAAWCGILRKIPGSRLLLHAPEGQTRQRISDLFADEGINPDRLRFTGRVPTSDYFKLYHQMDLMLDSFPRGGGTTLLDALWMGVPVVSLAGKTALSRTGWSILSNAGLPELAARDASGYGSIACSLARDLTRLENLRSSLRARIEKSPLMDPKRFACGVEAAYLTMWKAWCAKGSSD